MFKYFKSHLFSDHTIIFCFSLLAVGDIFIMFDCAPLLDVGEAVSGKVVIDDVRVYCG